MRSAVGTALAVLIAATTGVGAAVINHGDHQPAPHPAPTASASPAVWIQRLDDACTAMDANHSSFGGTDVTGQDSAQLRKQYQRAVANWQTAAKHLTPQQLSKECTP